MSDLAAWTRLTGLLTDYPAVLAQVHRAVTDPEGYLAEHADDLAERGIDDAVDVEPVIALIDALIAIDEVAYVDWNDPADVVADELGALPRVAAAGVVPEGEGRVEEVVAAVNAQLAAAGVVLVALDEDSDAYALVAVPQDRLAAVQEAGRAVGDIVRLLG